MITRTKSKGFTLVELLVVIAIIGVLIALLLPAVQAAREAARRSTCVNNLKQLGLAIHNHHDAKGYFPVNGYPAFNSPNNCYCEGWSWIFKSLPFMEYSSIYNTVPQPNRGPGYGLDPSLVGPTPTDIATRQVIDTEIGELFCPSNQNQHSAFSGNALGSNFALTNYKAMGATCMESLDIVTQKSQSGVAAVPYGTLSAWTGRDDTVHPDGGYPPLKTISTTKISDGTAHTIMATETQDNSIGPGSGQWGRRWPGGSAWASAPCTVLVGMPGPSFTSPSSTPTSAPISFAAVTDSTGTKIMYFAPRNFLYSMYGTDNTDVTYQTFKTFLQFDWEKRDAGSYPGWYTEWRIWTQPKYGPGAAHPAVVNHMMGDASVKSLVKDIDVSVYMFLITRKNGDPFVTDQVQ